MITFQQAKALKAGDIVYSSGYTCYVVRVELNEDEQSARIIHTDGGTGGDKFEQSTGDPRLSLTR